MVLKLINLKDYAVGLKPKLAPPLANIDFKIHFEAIDGVQPKIAETVEEKEYTVLL